MWANTKYLITSLANTYQPGHDLEADIVSLSFRTVMFAGLFLLLLIGIGTLTKDRLPSLNTPLFLLICLNVVAATLVLLGSTVYLNTVSVSKGPVHYHADFEIWECGDKKIELKDPEGAFSNKIGTATLHEHNDERIHLEGVVVEERDASLGKFFYVIGGEISDNSLVVPVNSDSKEAETFIDGESCEDGSIGDVQVFVFMIGKTADGEYETRVVDGQEKQVYYQMKLDDPASYIINGESIVPPGDCIIIEFDVTKDSTDKLCEQYKVNDTGRTITNEDGEQVPSLGNIIYGGLIDSDGNLIDDSNNENQESSSSAPFGNESNPNYDAEIDAECALLFEGTSDPSVECIEYRERLLEGEEDA